MPRPTTSIDERINRLAEWDENHLHHVWHGKLRRGRPELKGVGNPVRHLYGLNDHRIQIRPRCSHPACINPDHWRVIVTQDHKYGDLPPPALPRFLEEAEECISLGLSIETLIEEGYPANVIAEVRRKLGS